MFLILASELQLRKLYNDLQLNFILTWQKPSESIERKLTQMLTGSSIEVF